MKGTALILFSVFALALCGDAGLNANGCPNDYELHKVLPHDTYCNLFYSCVGGDRIELRCPGELLFNDKLEVCDWPSSVDCGGKGISDAGSEEGGGSGPNPSPGGNGDPSAAPEICARENSDGILVAHEYCNKFYKCDRGVPAAIECSPGLLYNFDMGWCDWPFNVECGDRINPSAK